MTFEKQEFMCQCGIESPIVKKIEGRKLDFLYANNGAKVTVVNIANGFKNTPNSIIRAQVTQERIGEVQIALVVDKNKYKTEYDKLIIDEFLHKFGANTKITIKHVEEIKREKSGKFRIIKNNVKK